MESPCRIRESALIAALLDDAEPQPVDRCGNPATEVAILGATWFGVEVFAHVPVCLTHDRDLSVTPGYERSIRLRSRPGAATSSPAADS
jgi:hypothetical protein